MTTTLSAPTNALRSAPVAARAVLRILARFEHGTLDLQLPNGATARFGSGSPAASVHIADWNVFIRVLKGGDIGFAEGYIANEWSSPDLTALLTLLIANRDELERVVYGSWWGSLLYRVRHALNRNSRRGSTKNVHAHYDLGNAFYAQWLDPTMNYSSAWFEGDLGQPLAQAQMAKVRRALREAGVTRGARVLEIGCGWGALAEVAASEFGAHVTGVTLSSEQLAWGQRRLHEAGLAERIELRWQDYRDLATQHEAEPFDAIVSIEMFEAVGREYWNRYFDTLQRCLKPGGRACIQSITIRDDLFERYVRSTDFIQQYIFPGGLLPSVSAFEAQARRAGFTVERKLAFGLDYAETLKRWRISFAQREREVGGLGFDARFMRIWHFYLAYCEAAFLCGNTDVVQFTLRRNRTRGVPTTTSVPTLVSRARGWQAAWTLAVAMGAFVAALVIARPSVAEPTTAASAATNAVASRAPLEVAGALPSARLHGSGTLRYFGLAIYEARLWAAPDFAPGRYDAHPFALELRYARKLGGAAIAERSITEMRRVGPIDAAQAKAWLEQMTLAFPDVQPSDRLTGVRGPDGATRFYRNGQPTSSIADPEFGRLFFGIWLSSNTSEPALRRQLIGQSS